LLPTRYRPGAAQTVSVCWRMDKRHRLGSCLLFRARANA